MSWQLGAFAILFVALAAGFAWYERSRPDARVVALVATLAAFAALGRIAFAAVPNVKPTTDIVLISGYALGPAPGFVVGAVAGLSSNFFFGQGPWTPWQMAGWGATGLIGAGLGALSSRRVRRWPLAIACAVVGFGFTALQDVGDWVNYSAHSAAQLGVYVGKGLGFDAVHAAGCLVFAFAFGPALARSLARFTRRLQVKWRPAEGAALVVAGLLVVGGVRAAHAADTTTPAGYLLAAENADGGFGPAPSQASTQLFSGWAALGLAAEGYNPASVKRGANSVIGYLRAGVASDTDPGSIERTILAVAAAGGNPTGYGGRDLVAALEAVIARDGSVSEQTNLTSFAVLALRAAGAAPAPRTLAWLVAQQDRDGGFNFATSGGTSDSDDTGAALEALAGDSSQAAAHARSRAVVYLERLQNHDGGFGASVAEGSNAQSTAWAVQGLIAAGTDPSSLHRRGAPSPLRYLDSLIAPDGHIRYSRASDQTPVWVTAEAVMALARKTLPLGPVRATPTARSHPVRHGKRHRNPVHHARAGAVGTRRRVRATAAASSSSLTMRLATDAGLLDALALAPLGIG